MEQQGGRVGWNQDEEGWDGTKVRKDGMESRWGRMGWNLSEEGWVGTTGRKGGMEPRWGRMGWNLSEEGWDGTTGRKGGMGKFCLYKFHWDKRIKNRKTLYKDRICNITI